MEPTWQVRAVWQGRDGATSEQHYRFANYVEARQQVTRLSSHLGQIGQDNLALKGLEISGNFWGVLEAPVRADPGWDEWIRPRP